MLAKFENLYPKKDMDIKEKEGTFKQIARDSVVKRPWVCLLADWHTMQVALNEQAQILDAF